MTSNADIVVMSSKGQVVVPKGVRNAVDADIGTQFVVFGSGSTIILRKIEVPSFSQKELEKMVAQSEKKLKQAGFVTEQSRRNLVEEAIAQTRKR
ncbi:MAG: hypothetical protein WC408_02860 [Candidatus Micrarchaeia archaeon]|jgi:AbrB family looped-hinge helix DNA binding protein